MKIFTTIIFTAMTFIGCQEKSRITASEATDPQAAKKEVSDVLDSYHQGLKTKNLSAMSEALTEDGLFCGTDPGELWDKESFSAYMTKAFADTTSKNIEYAIDTRDVRISDDGQSAIVTEQFQMDELSKRIRTRMITHLISTNEGWKIDFSSLAMIPANADLGKLDKALESLK